MACHYSKDTPPFVECHVIDEGIDEGALGQFNEIVLESLDVHTNVISRVALVFNRQVKVLQSRDDTSKLFLG